MQRSLLALIRPAQDRTRHQAQAKRNFRSRPAGGRIALGEWRFGRYADDPGDSQFGKKGKYEDGANYRCALPTPASRSKVMIAISAAALPPLAVVKSEVARACETGRATSK